MSRSKGYDSPIGGNIMGAQHGAQQFPNMTIAEIVSNVDNKSDGQNRFRIRLIGHEGDLARVQDKDLVYATTCTPETALRGCGYNPRYQPGDRCLVWKSADGTWVVLGALRNQYRADQEGGQQGSGGGGMNQGQVSGDVNPHTLDGGLSPKDPPARNQERQMGWRPEIPTETARDGIGSTIIERQLKRNFEQSKKVQAEEYSNPDNRRPRLRFMDDDQFKSIGQFPAYFDNTQDPSAYIQKEVQNKGAAIPEILPMLQNLKRVNGKQNPEAIVAVGPGNYTAFIGQLQSFFSALFQKQKKDKKDSQKQNEEQERLEAQLDRAYELLLLEEQGLIDEEGNIVDNG